MVKKQNKKPKKLHNFLESLDQFKMDHNFQYTKKKAKGSLAGFCLTVVFNILLLAYLHNRVSLFWTHSEDNINTSKVVIDDEEL